MIFLAEGDVVFESKDENTVRVESSRYVYIMATIAWHIYSFIHNNIYDVTNIYDDYYECHEANLTDYAINKYNVKEDEIVDFESTAKNILIRELMIYQNIVLDATRYKGYKDYVAMKKALKGRENLQEILRCLKNKYNSLDIEFEKEVVEPLEEQLKQHIDDLNDLKRGRSKTIEQKKQIIEEENERYSKALDEIERDARQVYNELLENGAFDDDEPYYREEEPYYYYDECDDYYEDEEDDE